jgi:Kef-type K+ transport system membrane component KefB
MRDAHAFLQNIALVLCVAAIATMLFQRLRQPVVFGYLLAGMIVGPHIPIPLVADEEMIHTLSELGTFLAGLIGVGLLVIPRAVRAVVRMNRPETTLVASVGICFAAALLALSFGYSVALGAFIAGSLVAESGEQKVVEHLVQPVRDMFAAIFFIGIAAPSG